MNPFTNPDALWEENLKMKDIKLKQEETPKEGKKTVEQKTFLPHDGGIFVDDDQYVFTNIHWQDKVLPAVGLSKRLLANDANKTQADWVSWSEKNEWAVADVEVLYQCMRRVYDLRNKQDDAQKEVLKRFQTVFD